MKLLAALAVGAVALAVIGGMLLIAPRSSVKPEDVAALRQYAKLAGIDLPSSLTLRRVVRDSTGYVPGYRKYAVVSATPPSIPKTPMHSDTDAVLAEHHLFLEFGEFSPRHASSCEWTRSKKRFSLYLAGGDRGFRWLFETRDIVDRDRLPFVR